MMSRWFRSIAYEHAAHILEDLLGDAELRAKNVEILMRECEVTEKEAEAILDFIGKEVAGYLRAKET